MNLRHKLQLSLHPPCPQVHHTFIHCRDVGLSPKMYQPQACKDNGLMGVTHRTGVDMGQGVDKMLEGKMLSLGKSQGTRLKQRSWPPGRGQKNHSTSVGPPG